jgi:coproporphyrinogen III oxidase
MTQPPLKERAHALYSRLQGSICAALEEADGEATFGRDSWDRPQGGGGLTRVIAEGPLFEKGAVNVSSVWGPAPPQLVEHLKVEANTFFAAGVSMIFHPRNPHAPTMHANLRYFETDGGAAWFGGGCDLTPYYLYEEDARHFHGVLRDCCGRHPVADYPAWKAWCDRYFMNTHRGEARGVGGLFFDHLQGDDMESILAMQEDLGGQLVPSYLPLLERRRDTPYTPDQERWHLQRRGRYVEFNLVHDRGTRFGLQTGGRIESILVSMPPRVRWDYDVRPEPGSPEAALLDLVSGEPRDWV